MDSNILEVDFASATPSEKPATETPTEVSETETPAVEAEETEETEAEETEAEEADEPEAEERDEKPKDGEGCDPKTLANAKKELGIGGAAFCDELFATCPDVFAKLKAAGKTLHGFFNYAYSYALDEYVKKNGKTNGGGYWNLASLAEKYLDPNVKEGFTIKEPKAKSVAPDPKKVVEKVAKKAASDAKKEAKKTKTEPQLDLFGDLFK